MDRRKPQTSEQHPSPGYLVLTDLSRLAINAAEPAIHIPPHHFSRCRLLALSLAGCGPLEYTANLSALIDLLQPTSYKDAEEPILSQTRSGRREMRQQISYAHK